MTGVEPVTGGLLSATREHASDDCPYLRHRVLASTHPSPTKQEDGHGGLRARVARTTPQRFSGETPAADTPGVLRRTCPLLAHFYPWLPVIRRQ